MRRSFISFILSFGSLVALSQPPKEKHITVDGRDRFYLFYAPTKLESGKKYPLVLVLHGGGGNASRMMEFSGFNRLAESEKFFVLYPNGYKKGWHDGRLAQSIDANSENIDDVKFIKTIIEDFEKTYLIDNQRIFSTGISNGAMMSLHLAYKLSDKIRAIAPICGNIAVNQEKEYNPAFPVSVLVINGTEDKLVPYDGGAVLREKANRGRVISTTRMMDIWKSLHNISGEPIKQTIPDKDPSDGCTAERFVYSASVQLIRINHGGHSWPGGKQYLPKMIVGKVCRDFKAEEVIWDFFKSQPLRN